MNATGAIGQVLSFYSQAQRQLFDVLECPSAKGALGRNVNRALVGLILANILAVILESFDVLQRRYHVFFDAFELLSVAVFTIEYILRSWVAICDSRYSEPLSGRIRYLFSLPALIDLAAILPSLLTGFTADFRFIRAMRILRSVRIWKLTRYSRALNTIRVALLQCSDQMVAVVAILLVTCVLASGLMYAAEHDAQPAKFSNVVAAMWWTLQTLTMISYNDMTPVTPIGKFIGVLIGLVGIGLFAMPAGILASTFIEQLKQARRSERKCPHCGEALSTD
jgi:voltage-gated potassium channel